MKKRLKTSLVIFAVGAFCLLGLLPLSASAYQEAPELRALVEAGKLPPVEERLPKEPLVLRGVDGLIGEYGGVLRVSDVNVGTPVFNMADKLVMSWQGTTASIFCTKIISLESQEDGRVWLVHYREGLRWSDGALATVDDTMFFIEDFAMNKELNPKGHVQLLGDAGGEPLKYEKIDDYTLRITAAESIDPVFKWRSFPTYALWYPKHYLKQFHPNYTDKETLDRMVKEAGLGSWVQLFEMKTNIVGNMTDPDFPSMLPWLIAEPAPATPAVWKRNPYYFVVDEAGNQLPYIDEIHQVFTGSEDVRTFNILAGDVDYAQALGIQSYPLLKKAEEEGKIKIHRWAESAFNTAQVEFNLTHEDSVMREIFQNKDFRFACSYAIDRQQICDIFYFGAVKPTQVAPTAVDRFYHERLANTAIEYDPERANRMLDEMGLDKRDADGYRMRPDGKTLEITLVAPVPWLADAAELGEMITENLTDVGLKINLRLLEIKLFGEMMWDNRHDGMIMPKSWSTGRQGEAWSCHWKMGPGTLWAPLWRKWWKGEEGGEVPPAPIVEACQLSDLAQKGTPEEQKVLMKRVLDIAADNLWTIGTTEVFGIIVVSNPNLKNVPSTFELWAVGYTGAELWFYEK